MSSDPGPAHRRGRTARSRLAKPLLTSIGVVTLLAASSIVVVGVAATGSARPWDWTGADPAAAVGRYHLCGGHGVSTLGCMISAGVRQAAATGNATNPPVARRPLETVVTIQDRATPAATPRPVRTPAPARAAGSPRPSPSPSGSPRPPRGGDD